MSKSSIYIESFSALHHSGIYCQEEFRKWEEDQKGPVDIKRTQVLPSPFPLFGKLNTPDKLAFSAASLCLSGIEEPGGEETGITLGLPVGSLSTDLKYTESIRSGFPSPAYFSATLPSSPIADTAIYYKMKGPNRVFAGGDSPVLSALDTASQFLQQNRAQRILVLGVWECIQADSYLQEKVPDCAVALFCTSAAKNNASAVMEVELWSGNGNEGKETGEQDLFVEVIKALFKREPVRIPVSERGFEGYISINYV